MPLHNSRQLTRGLPTEGERESRRFNNRRQGCLHSPIPPTDNCGMTRRIVLAVVVTVAALLILPAVWSFDLSPRLDITDRAAFVESAKRMAAGMSEEQIRDLYLSMMVLAYPDEWLVTADGRVGIDKPPDVPTHDHRAFKDLHGMTVANIHAKAKPLIEAKSREAEKAGLEPPKTK